jgi:hypothetical protein
LAAKVQNKNEKSLPIVLFLVRLHPFIRKNRNDRAIAPADPSSHDEQRRKQPIGQPARDIRIVHGKKMITNR